MRFTKLSCVLTWMAASVLAAPAAWAVPVPVNRVAPDYPAQAIPLRLAGVVKVNLVIDATGAVSRADLISESPKEQGFGEAALAAARQWTFEQSKPGEYEITLRFEPGDGGGAVDPSTIPLAPVPLKKGEPYFPSNAAAMRINGYAEVAVLIGNDGRVVHSAVLVEVPEGYGFGDSVMNSMSRWEFQPGHPGLFRVGWKFESWGDGRSTDWDDLSKLPEPNFTTAPRYPETADGSTGSVRLAVAVADDGSVVDVQVVTETPPRKGFGEAARQAMLQWHFVSGQQGLYRYRMTISK